MEQLSALDAGFLEAEDSDPHISLAIGGLSIIDGPIPDDDALRAGIGERLLSVPRFQQVLHTHRLDLGAPEWVDAVGMDLSHHIRRAAVPAPHDDKALFRLVADTMERRLDRDRPLWECSIIEGLADGRWAILMKVHHCIADGIAAVRLLTGLCDEGSGETFATEIHAAQQRRPAKLRLPVTALDPARWAAGIWQTSRAVTHAAVLGAEGAAAIAGGLLRPTAPSSLTGPVTSRRCYSAAQASFADVAKLCHQFDVTVNDVALTAITGGFRQALIRRGVAPQRNSLRTLVPVSVRSSDAADAVDNRFSLMLPHLPVEEPDPMKQLRAVHSRLTRVKASGQWQAGSIFVSAVNVVPFPLTAWAVRAMLRLPQRGVVTLATNVPGPRHRLSVMGRDVVRMLPIPPIGLQLRVVIAILSYADHLEFGITGDLDSAPDVDELARDIESAAASLVAASTGRRRPSRRQRRTLSRPTAAG